MTKEVIEKIEDAYRRVRKIGPDAIYETELREVLRAAADALATRVPVRGEPNDDRESPRVSMEVIREYRHILAWLEEQSALRAPTGDTMHGLAAEALSVLIEHEYSRHKIPLYGMLDVWQALYETSHPEWDEFYEKHGYAETWARLLDEVRSRATVPDARDHLHAKCDCVPDLGPAHCHLCAGEGSPVRWEDCEAVREIADVSEPVEVVLTTTDIEGLAHLLVQLSPATQKNSGATIRRLLREINIKEVGQ